MDTTYLVEIRLGRTKWRIKQDIASIAARFHLDEHIEQHPHVTIFGPLVLNPNATEGQLLEVIGWISGRFDPIPFMLDGWEKRKGMNGSVIAFAVRPSGPLIMLTRDIAEALLPLCSSMNAWDPQPENKWFHVTVANHLDPDVAATVFYHLTGNPAQNTGRIVQLRDRLHSFIHGTNSCRAPEFAPVLLDEAGLRLTVMKGEEILAEYDFSKKEWLYEGHSHNEELWQNTLRAYRRAAGFERRIATEPDSDDIYVISDLHLGHSNIIRYCSRPFLRSDVDEMDAVLIRNWNSVIGPDSQVFFLGDLRYGESALPAQQYLKELKGKITFISGNHDDCEPVGLKSTIIDYEEFRFLFIHDPDDAPPAFDGWVIHGHHHNNNLHTYPFLDPAGRQINVSAETIGYVPISLREICDCIRQYTGTGKTDPILLRYPHVS